MSYNHISHVAAFDDRLHDYCLWELSIWNSQVAGVGRVGRKGYSHYLLHSLLLSATYRVVFDGRAPTLTATEHWLVRRVA